MAMNMRLFYLFDCATIQCRCYYSVFIHRHAVRSLAEINKLKIYSMKYKENDPFRPQATIRMYIQHKRCTGLQDGRIVQVSEQVGSNNNISITHKKCKCDSP